ncbi:MAG: hypothetical protein ACRCXZ_02095 [Patescibacteria group bacterium]
MHSKAHLLILQSDFDKACKSQDLKPSENIKKLVRNHKNIDFQLLEAKLSELGYDVYSSNSDRITATSDIVFDKMAKFEDSIVNVLSNIPQKEARQMSDDEAITWIFGGAIALVLLIIGLFNIRWHLEARDSYVIKDGARQSSTNMDIDYGQNKTLYLRHQDKPIDQRKTDLSTNDTHWIMGLETAQPEKVKVKISYDTSNTSAFEIRELETKGVGPAQIELYIPASVSRIELIK